ncbi:MAG: Rieske 2Fe-2S domain-containing protein [Candidatus Latescibacterota bacterium]|nr:Rieske 2Fe-2S domain-containing protein [Candidatus Latescibacterota bacterium]
MTSSGESDQPDADVNLSGLQWLSRERPQAMEHLLAFFGESGRHLEPKTRFLISIVTKVINFSGRGLRQYIPRAYREGASRDEILDAILCSYPAAGLTRVVDAVQVLRSLNLEDKNESADSAAPEWTAVARASQIGAGESLVAKVRGCSIALFNVDDRYYAVDNRCLHQGGELGCGVLQGSVVTCSRHGWQFDVTNGNCLTVEGRSVLSYPAKEQEGEILVLA